jgi:hypothetical protein
MTNNKQSSVEYLIEHLLPKALTVEQYYHIEQAKAMHKEEMMDAYFFGQRLHAKSITNTMMEENSEQYYNETFTP